MIPNEGEVQLLTELLSGGTLEDWELGLFTTNPTLAATDNEAAILAYEATFSGYARKTLTRSVSGSTWSTPSSSAPTGTWSSTQAAVAESTYNASAPQTWTYSGSSAVLYGWFLVGATSGKLILTKLFPSSQPIEDTNTISFAPIFGGASVSGS